MNKSLRLISDTVRKSLWKHHFTIFLVAAAGGAALGIYSLFVVINLTTPTTQAGGSTATTFDQATIDKVNALGSGDNQQTFTMPTDQRTDPFLEG